MSRKILVEVIRTWTGGKYVSFHKEISVGDDELNRHECYKFDSIAYGDNKRYTSNVANYFLKKARQGMSFSELDDLFDVLYYKSKNVFGKAGDKPFSAEKALGKNDGETK